MPTKAIGGCCNCSSMKGVHDIIIVCKCNYKNRMQECTITKVNGTHKTEIYVYTNTKLKHPFSIFITVVEVAHELVEVH